MPAKKAAKPLNEAAQAAEPVSSSQDVYLDPDLVAIRDAEVERNSVKPGPREAPTIDPALLEQRERDIKAAEQREASSSK